jgi:hypothetical protein
LGQFSADEICLIFAALTLRHNPFGGVHVV